MNIEIAQSNIKPEYFTLDNGLKVLIQQDTRSDLVVSQLWYKVGSSFENNASTTGISHILEHMMFKGSKKFKPGEGSILLRNIGSTENAFTSADYTCYYQIFASNFLELILDIESDRMCNLSLLEDEFVKEIEVIKEERRLRVEDKPASLFYERVISQIYANGNSYAIPVIGWMEDLNRTTINDVRAWYEQYYAPNNATLVLVGNVDLQVAKNAINKYFSHIQSKKITLNKQPVNKFFCGERRLTMKHALATNTIIIAFNTPGMLTADVSEINALRMIHALFGIGFSSRFEKNIVRNLQTANYISVTYDPFCRGDTSFKIYAILNDDMHDFKQLEATIWQEFDNFIDEQIEQEELERSLIQIYTGIVFQKDSAESLALEFGALESIGVGFEFSYTELEGLKKVTIDNIKQTLKKYFVKDNVTVGILMAE